MTDVIGRGVIAIGADTSGATAGIEKVKKSVKSLGDASERASTRNSASIDRYVQKLVTQVNTFGKTNREVELYTLKLKGASAAQLQAANTALTLIERQKALQATVANASRLGALVGAGIAVGLTGAVYAFDQLIKRVADFQDIAEKTGDTAVNIASLSVAAAVGGTSMDALSTAAVKLNKNLLGVDDDSKDAGAAIQALGLDLQKVKAQAPSEQLRTLAQALSQVEDSGTKSQLAVALFGKSGAELLPFLKELGNETQKVSILTAEQLKIADEYADTQARVLEVTKQTIAGFVIDYIPAITETVSATAEWIRESGLAEVAITALRGALKIAGLGFQTIALIASDVIFVFQGVGREIGAIAAQLVALARLDFSGFRAISEAVKEDAKRARAELDKYQQRLTEVGDPKAVTPMTVDDLRRSEGRDRKKTIAFEGASKRNSENSKAAQEAKAQLQFDLDLLKQQSDGIRTIFAADEKILEAQRGANLISEREYFNEKRNLLILNQQEQESALQKEIARLGQEKLTGKDAIDNERKILKAKQELQKLRTTGDADLRVLAIQEAEAIQKVARAYEDARVAAAEYIATVARRNSSEIDSLGKGDKERARLQGLAAIEDRFLSEKARLERDKRNAGNNEQLKAQLDAYINVARETYKKEVELFNERTVAIEAKQRDWVTGYTEALNNYIDQSRDIASQSQEIFSNLFGGLEDTITDFVTKGKADFKGLFDSLAADITRSIVRQKLGEFAEFTKGNPDSIVGKIFGGIGAVVGNNAAGAGATTAGVAAQTAAVTANTAAVAASTATISAATTASSVAMTALASAATAAATALALVAANSAAKAGGDGLGAFISAMGNFAGRASGGPVSAGGMYRVNERGPELLQVAGKEYLMMGSHGGNVKPVSGGGSATTVVQVQVTPPPGSSRETAYQWGNLAGRQINASMRRNG